MRSVTLLSYCLISVLFVACSSENPQPAQEETKLMAQQSEQAPAESEPEEQPTASQPAGTAPETAASTEKMAEIKAKPAESGETMAAQEESASQVEQMKSYPKLSLGPNMARVTASIVDVEKTENSYFCTLNIEQILGTGPSTPPLVRGNEIKVWIKKVVDHSEKLAGKEGTVEVTLHHVPPLASIQPPPPAWNVLEVH